VGPAFSTTSHAPTAGDRHAPAEKPVRTNDADPVVTVAGGTKAVCA
jgi:hypothetical protein